MNTELSLEICLQFMDDGIVHLSSNCAEFDINQEPEEKGKTKYGTRQRVEVLRKQY
jgi:hypothetical protein